MTNKENEGWGCWDRELAVPSPGTTSCTILGKTFNPALPLFLSPCLRGLWAKTLSYQGAGYTRTLPLNSVIVN